MAKAERGTFCWSTKRGSLCADALDVQPTHALRVRPDDDVWIDLRVRARKLSLEGDIGAGRSASDGSMWRLHLPERLPRVLRFDVEYARGSAAFAVGLSR